MTEISTQITPPQAIAAAKEALNLLSHAITAARTVSGDSAEKLEDAIIMIGAALKTGRNKDALDLFTALNSNFGVPFLNEEAKRMTSLNKGETNFTLDVDLRQREFIALFEERQALFIDFLIPLREKIMLLALEANVTKTA